MIGADKIHFDAAEGWLGLGIAQSAIEELENISPENRSQPDVLSLRWDSLTYAGAHETAEGVARNLTEIVPGNFEYWCQLSHSLHESGRTQEAYETLSGVSDRFGDEWMLHHFAAIYLCRLGRLDQARMALNRTLELNPDHRIDALEDPDLEPLWKETLANK